MRNLILCFLLLWTFQVLSQVSQSDNLPKVKTSEVKNFKLKSGSFEKQLSLKDGTTWDLHFDIPELPKDAKVPLIIALRWAGGGNTYLEYANCLAVPALKEFGGIIVSPSSNGLPWIARINEVKLIDFIKTIVKHWPIDPDKVIVTGYSNGGIGSWYLAIKYPKLFAAAIPMAAQYTGGKVKIPVYIIHGKEDELFKLVNILPYIQKSKEQGSEIDLSVSQGKSHYMACSYVSELKTAVGKVKKEVFE